MIAVVRPLWPQLTEHNRKVESSCWSGAPSALSRAKTFNNFYGIT